MSPAADRVERFLGAALALLVAFMAVGTFAEVAMRAVFGAAPVSVREAMPDLFVWATFLGAALAARRGLHLGIPVLRDRLGAGLRRALEGLTLLATLLFFAAVLWGAVGVLTLSLRFGERMPLGYPAALVEAAVPVGAIAIAWASVMAWRERDSAMGKEQGS